MACFEYSLNRTGRSGVPFRDWCSLNSSALMETLWFLLPLWEKVRMRGSTSTANVFLMGQSLHCVLARVNMKLEGV